MVINGAPNFYQSSVQRTIEDIRTAKKLQKESCQRNVSEQNLLSRSCKSKVTFQKQMTTRMDYQKTIRQLDKYQDNSATNQLDKTTSQLDTHQTTRIILLDKATIGQLKNYQTTIDYHQTTRQPLDNQKLIDNNLTIMH